MGREVKRVPLDFEWDGVWPGYMVRLCDEEIKYTMPKKDPSIDEICARCKAFARLAGIKKGNQPGCPDVQIHPPVGDGWQLWETVTEGSPISPVFATPEELARWIADGNDWPDTVYEHALAFVRRGWAPTLVIDSDGVRPGIQDDALVRKDGET